MRLRHHSDYLKVNTHLNRMKVVFACILIIYSIIIYDYLIVNPRGALTHTIIYNVVISVVEVANLSSIN